MTFSSEPDSRALRLLMVAPSAVAGGMEDIMFNLALGLPDEGIDVEIVSLQAGPLVERLRDAGLPVELIDAGRLREPGNVLRTVRRLSSILRSGRFDVVYSNMPKAHLYVALAAARARIPAIWCQAGYPDPAHWIDRLASRLPASGLIALSRDAATVQRRLSGARPVHMLHPGIDLTRFRVTADPDLRAEHQIPADAVLISLVGRLQPWKGQREFLRAAALLAEDHPAARFAIVGGALLGWEGDYPEELQRLAATLGLEDRVLFTGHTEHPQRWMAASDIVVNASAPEPFGLVVVEAMASGCAVVAVASGGPRDVIEDGHSGILCATREPAALAAGLRRVLDQPRLREALGPSARERVESAFSRERMTDAFAEIVRGSARPSGAVGLRSPGRLGSAAEVVSRPVP